MVRAGWLSTPTQMTMSWRRKKAAGLLHTRTSEGPQVIDLNRSDPIDLGWDLHAAVCEARIRSGPAQKTQDGFCVFGVWRRFVLKRLCESLPYLIWYKSCSLSFLSTSLPLLVRLTMPLQYTFTSKLLYLWHETLHLSLNFIQSVYPKFNYADLTRIQTITVYCQAWGSNGFRHVLNASLDSNCIRGLVASGRCYDYGLQGWCEAHFGNGPNGVSWIVVLFVALATPTLLISKHNSHWLVDLTSPGVEENRLPGHAFKRKGWFRDVQSVSKTQSSNRNDKCSCSRKPIL